MDIFVWLTPTLAALFLYGIGQGLVKKYIADVPPAQFCLYFVAAKAVVNMGFFLFNDHPPPFALEGRSFLYAGLLVYVIDGAAWVLYFESIVAGPITIVGTLSAAYPALTVVFAWLFLGETLSAWQYVGVVLVILGCVGLSYEPSNSSRKIIQKRWVPQAVSALILWGTSQTLLKYVYGLPQANEANLTLFNTLGGIFTLGFYGLLRGGAGGVQSLAEWGRSFLPMGMMAGGDLGVIIATRAGPVSIVAPLSGAYPVVTLGFAWVVLKERLNLLQWISLVMVLVGIFLAPGGL